MLAAITAPVLVSLSGSLFEKIEPSRTQMTAGNANVSTICSGRR
jgi:hypothetical protein